MAIHRAALLFALFTLPSWSATYFVAPDGDNSDGLTWESGFTTIGEAFIAASPGDHIWVASATYAENIEFVTGVQLYGGFLGTEAPDQFHLRDYQANETIIDATGTDQNAVVINADCVLDGFTVTGGGKVEEPVLLPILGGIEGEGDTSRSAVRNCHISRNLHFGIHDFHGEIDRNVIMKTIGIDFVGLGRGIRDCDGNIIENEICFNREGGGILHSDGWIIGNKIYQNRGSGGAGVASGGRLVNNLIYGNYAIDLSQPSGVQGSGGGVFGVTLLRYNTVVFNEAYVLYGGIESGINDDHHYGNIIWGNFTTVNSGGIDPSENPRKQVSHPELDSFSCIQGIDSENGNFPDNPLFFDPENDNFRLQVNSPCIDSASTAGPSTDLDGNPRPVDIIGIGREGAGAFDMGAYEFQAPRSDLNSDGYVNALDLMIFQQDWMKVSGP